jgi:hypothetical protein
VRDAVQVMASWKSYKPPKGVDRVASRFVFKKMVRARVSTQAHA